ncbi:MAG: hypothetical protein PHF84_05235 [bacterium]|nr:hypothetical protein [bacterium]
MMKKNAVLYLIFTGLFYLVLAGCQREKFWSVPVYAPSEPHTAPPWIDDFDHDNDNFNLLMNPGACPTGTYDGPTASRPQGYSLHEDGSMKIGVSANTNTRWFGFYSSFDSTGYPNTLGIDVTSYTAVSFKIKGSMDNNPSGSGLQLSVRSVNTPVGREIYKLLTFYLASGLNASWQTVVMPFRDYNSATNWSSRLSTFTISFKDAAGQPASGTIWIDDLRFLP